MTARRRRTTDRTAVRRARAASSCWSSRPTRWSQMVAMSFTNWSLITPPKFIGLDNFQARVQRRPVLGLARLHPQVHAAHHPDPDDRRLPARPARRAEHAAPADRPAAIIFVPVVIGLGVSSLLWYWLFDPTFGLINRALIDLGLIDKPIRWLGVDADLSTWAIIGSVVWKVLGFGMILFVAAIQAIPSEINEATMVDGASFWQRTRRVTVPLTPPHDPAGHPDQRHRLAARVRPVLHHDRGPAVQPDGDGRLLHLPELVPVPASRVRRGAVADPGADHPRLHGRPDGADPAEPTT